MDEFNAEREALTDEIVAYLIARCREESVSSAECDSLQKRYGKCQICADEVVRKVFPIITAEEQRRITNMIQTAAPPICAKSSCPAR